MDLLNCSKNNRKEMLKLPFEDRWELTNSVIKQVLYFAKKPLIQFSGGADSCLMAWMINQINKTVPAFFADWGLFLPRQKEFCEKFFKKYDMKYLIKDSGINYKEFLSKNGFPIFKGVRPFITPKDFKKYNITGNCRSLKNRCWRNLLKTYPCDYYFCGILADESPQRKSLFIQYGFVSKKKDGSTLVKPIELIKKKEVFELLEKYSIPYPKDMYRDTFEGKHFKYNHCDLGCFICNIRFKELGWGRLGRLARENPDLYKEVMDMGLRDSLEKIVIDFPKKAEYIANFLKYYPTIPFKRTAYDLDGVLLPLLKRNGCYFKQSTAERNEHENKKRYLFKYGKVLRIPLEKEFYIISSRRERYRNLTENWLKDNKINYKELILMEGSLTFKKIVEHKYKYLREKKIEKYYEDDKKVIEWLKKRLPHIEFIHIERNNLNVLTVKDIEMPMQQSIIDIIENPLTKV